MEAQKAFKVIARAISTSSGNTHGTIVAQLYEGLSVKLMRAATRSTLACAADAAASSFNPALARAQTELDLSP